LRSVRPWARRTSHLRPLCRRRRACYVP
jgi:hypothetical protein